MRFPQADSYSRLDVCTGVLVQAAVFFLFTSVRVVPGSGWPGTLFDSVCYVQVGGGRGKGRFFLQY